MMAQLQSLQNQGGSRGATDADETRAIREHILALMEKFSVHASVDVTKMGDFVVSLADDEKTPLDFIVSMNQMARSIGREITVLGQTKSWTLPSSKLAWS